MGTTLLGLVEELTPVNLVDLLECYENYCQHFYDNHDKGSTPVSILEFWGNDYEDYELQ